MGFLFFDQLVSAADFDYLYWCFAHSLLVTAPDKFPEFGANFRIVNNLIAHFAAAAHVAKILFVVLVECKSRCSDIGHSCLCYSEGDFATFF